MFIHEVNKEKYIKCFSLIGYNEDNDLYYRIKEYLDIDYSVETLYGRKNSINSTRINLLKCWTRLIFLDAFNNKPSIISDKEELFI